MEIADELQSPVSLLHNTHAEELTLILYFFLQLQTH